MTPISNRRQLSYSSLNTLAGCAHRYDLNKGYTHPASKFLYLPPEAGHTMHLGYQDWLIHHDTERALLKIGIRYPHKLEWDSLANWSWEACMATFEAMIECDTINEYMLANIKCLDGVVRPAVEVPFELIFDGVLLPNGQEVSFIGYIDAIMLHKITKQYFTLDIKTHRATNSNREGVYKHDTQQIPYGIVIEHMLGKKIDFFNVMYLDCFVDVLEPKIQVYEYTKSAKSIENWLLSKILQIRTIQTYMQLDYWPRKDGGCMFFNKPCRYLDLCVSDNRELIQSLLIMNEEPAPPRKFEPWIVGTLEIPEGVI